MLVGKKSKAHLRLLLIKCKLNINKVLFDKGLY